MKTFLIGGAVIADEDQRWGYDEVTPGQVRAFFGNLDEGEEVEIQISSPGGDVAGGIAISNIIREASRDGHKSTAHVVGVAASIASVIACACDELVMDASSLMMVHNPWTETVGNADELRKDAETLDLMRDAMMSIYRTKFDRTDDEIKALLDAETWIVGSAASDFGLNAKVAEGEAGFRAAACVREVPVFEHAPEGVSEMFAVGHELTVTRSECEKRVAGLQAAKDKEIAALKETHAAELAGTQAKIDEFVAQLKAKDEELVAAKAETSRLHGDLEKSQQDLALEREHLATAQSRLAELGHAVNRPPDDETPHISAREELARLPYAERQAYYAKHKASIDKKQ